MSAAGGYGVGAGLFRRAMRRKERLSRVLLVAVLKSWIQGGGGEAVRRG